MHVPGQAEAVGGAGAAGSVSPKPAGPEAPTKEKVTVLAAPPTVVEEVF